jgi:hypothetical protein
VDDGGCIVCSVFDSRGSQMRLYSFNLKLRFFRFFFAPFHIVKGMIAVIPTAGSGLISQLWSKKENSNKQLKDDPAENIILRPGSENAHWTEEKRQKKWRFSKKRKICTERLYEIFK